MAIEALNRFETYFINRGDQALALADAVAPDVGVCLDCVPHEHRGDRPPRGDPRRSATRLVDFHVADNNRMACGMGQLDWPAIVGDAAGGRLRRGAHRRVRRTRSTARRPTSYPDAIETNPVDISPEELQFIIDHGSSLLSEGFYGMLVEKCATTLLPLI